MAPFAQSIGIAKGKGLLVIQRQLGIGDGSAKAFRAWQHAAGKNVGLDEVGTAAVALETGLVDADDLQHRLTAGLEAVFDLIEIGWPMLFAHRLKHLD